MTKVEKGDPLSQLPPDVKLLLEAAEDLPTLVKNTFDMHRGQGGVHGEPGAEGSLRMVRQLDGVLENLDEHLHSELLNCHEQLLQNASRVGQMEEQLGVLSSSVSDLSGELKRLQADVGTPFQTLKQHLGTVRRITVTKELVRDVSRFLFLVKKFITQHEGRAEGPKTQYEVTAALSALAELEAMLEKEPHGSGEEGKSSAQSAPALVRLRFLAPLVAFVRETGRKLRAAAAVFEQRAAGTSSSTRGR